ncbi:MAG: hypothetical protein KJZ70_15410 [Bryobacterales bacterium]|nr:hypothetical protein [Bryobacterales bacterium]
MPDRLSLADRSDPAGQPPALHETLRQFLSACRRPAVVEPGEPVLLLQEGEYSLEPAAKGALLEAWGESKVLRRRVTAIRREAAGRLDLTVEKFGRKSGVLTLMDAESGVADIVERDSARAVNLAALCRWCERLFPMWRIELSSCGADLENSLSPRFPRALLRMGSHAMAVLAAQDCESADDALAFGLIWFRHAQLRWPAFDVKTLALFVPPEAAVEMGLRLRSLNSDLVTARLFATASDGFPMERPAESWGNLDSAISSLPYTPADSRLRALFEETAAVSEAEVVEDLQGGLHLELRGLPLATCKGDGLRVGLSLRESRREVTVAQLRLLAERVARIRCEESAERQHPLYCRYPERWLEAMVRRNLSAIDPLIDATTVRRQVTGFLGAQHTRTDLLALDRHGKLVVIEIKASEDIALPVQALDYYTRLSLQLARGEIQASALFPNRTVLNAPPRLLLVAPALHFHSTNETVLRYFESSICVRQIGVAIEWRKHLRVVFDHPCGRNDPGGNREWQATYSLRSAKRSRR